MFRFLFRLAAMFALAVSVIMAVLDATRSVAASALVMTPLKTSWLAVSPDTLAATENFMRANVSPYLWDRIVDPVLYLPGFAVFAGLALVLYAIGHRPRRRIRHLAAS
ncbi:hypothetical protein [Manganibacter manganicus]|uniref:Uncharacterized protein n=1 Tax=Manganibacter manganicus TaxID=1873176 RepID=A0A1V8RSD3_9HYPH|nr:hypothetical protein [Pseudaminobacter manganicus]OQM76132.1 hypothetical protein BFN67_15810 [Pseudaminobacter manganicus]